MEFGDKRLTGPTIYLRGLRAQDATARYCGWLNDPEVTRFLDTKSATLQEISEYVKSKNGRPDALLLGIFASEGDRHIGTVKLDPINVAQKKSTIAIMIGDKEYWGKGIGGEAFRLLSDYGFDELELQEIWLGARTQNHAGIKMYARLGFKEVKVGKDDPMIDFDPNLYNEVVMVLKR